MTIETFGKIYLPVKMISKVLFLYLLLVSPVAQNAEQSLNFTLPDMIDIPAGEFEMGCVSSIDCKPREKPVHKVTVPAFQMAKTEVTAELWAACVEAKGCSHEPENNGWTELGMPIRYVSWDDVQVFITWLNSATSDHKLLVRGLRRHSIPACVLRMS